MSTDVSLPPDSSSLTAAELIRIRGARAHNLCGVDLDIPRNEFVVLTGPSGSGKSTLLSILCGLLRPTRGEVVHTGDGSEIERSDWRRHLGVVAPSMAVIVPVSLLFSPMNCATKAFSGRS